jgi:hypothetical protein
MTQSSKSSDRKAIIILIIIFVLGAAYIVNLARTQQTGNDTPDISPSMVSLICEKSVKAQLKAPSSAKFAPLNQQHISRITRQEYHYRVQSYVDSQNSFGAMLRSDFDCSVHYDPSTDQWHLDDLQIY